MWVKRDGGEGGEEVSVGWGEGGERDNSNGK